MRGGENVLKSIVAWALGGRDATAQRLVWLAWPAWFVALVLFSGAQPLTAQTEERGALLPLQDRLGDPILNVAVQDTLREALMERHTLVDRSRLRDALRRLRLRNASQASPATLQRLADEIEVDWFFTATLHTATETELSRAAQAFVGSGSVPVPQIILSARVFRKEPSGTGEAEAYLEWAGFFSASGLDSRRLLNMGVVQDPEILARRTALSLVDQFEERPSVDAPRPDRDGFLREAITVERAGLLAVLPFEGVSDRDANVAAETITSLALSVLDENGVRLAPPGFVNQVLRRRGILLRGEVDVETRSALHEAGVDYILTGTVEEWEIRGGAREPEPRVSFGARLIDAGSGQIQWMNGQDRGGWDGLNLFGTGRTHSRGRLAQHMMRSLVAAFFEEKNP
jgi:TolB-like protein